MINKKCNYNKIILIWSMSTLKLVSTRRNLVRPEKFYITKPQSNNMNNQNRTVISMATHSLANKLPLKHENNNFLFYILKYK